MITPRAGAFSFPVLAHSTLVNSYPTLAVISLGSSSDNLTRTRPKYGRAIVFWYRPACEMCTSQDLQCIDPFKGWPKTAATVYTKVVGVSTMSQVERCQRTSAATISTSAIPECAESLEFRTQSGTAI